MTTPSINQFKTAARFGDSRLKVSNGKVSVQTASAKRTFFGKVISTLSHAVEPEHFRTMGRFKQALSKETSDSATKMLESAVKQAKADLEKIDKTYNEFGYVKPKQKAFSNAPDAPTIMEMRNRLKLVANSVDLSRNSPLTAAGVGSAVKLTEIIEANRHDPMFKLMGPAKFLGYALQSEQNISKADQKYQDCAAKMTTCERVALFGYTCADYSTLNAGLRGGQADTKLQAYIDHATNGLKKCPVYTDNDGKTERSIKDPPGKDGWATERYKNGEQVTELAFTSSAVTAVKSSYTMKMTGQGYDVSPFSAWPKETEVLYPPGTVFQISVDPAFPNVFNAREMRTPGVG